MDADEVREKTVEACGWLEDAPGVKSSTRLFAAILLGLAAVVVGLIVWYVLKVRPVDAGVLASLAAVLGALVAQGAVAIIRRTV